MTIVKRDKLLEVCQMMVGQENKLRGMQRRKGLALIDQNGQKVALLHGHVGRGRQDEVVMGSALRVINQIAGRNNTLYEMAKYLLENEEFRNLKPLLRIEIAE